MRISQSQLGLHMRVSGNLPIKFEDYNRLYASRARKNNVLA